MTEAPVLAWMTAARSVLDQVATTQADALETASVWCADAMISVEGLDTPIGPASTISAVAIVNSIKVRTAQLLVERGAAPAVLTRPSVVGAERSRQLFDEAYRQHAHRYARAIAREGSGTGTTGQEVR